MINIIVKYSVSDKSFFFSIFKILKKYKINLERNLDDLVAQLIAVKFYSEKLILYFDLLNSICFLIILTVCLRLIAQSLILKSDYLIRF
jgi:hypothetical protein